MLPAQPGAKDVRSRKRSLMPFQPLETDGLFKLWVRASFFGWLIGLMIVILLSLVWNLLAAGVEADAQFMVGLGMGAGVGHVQRRALVRWLNRPNQWTVASTVGMGALFVVRDLVVVSGHAFPYSLPLYVLVGGAIAGFWQGRLLRHASAYAGWWPLASVIGWSIPAACIALGDSQAAGFGGDLASLLAIFFGGGMLGASSGRVLVWILRRPAP